MFAIKLIIPIVAVVAVVLLFLLGYVKAPPDRAFIISGFGRNPRILIGRAGIKLPFLERKDVLYLGQMSVDIKTEQSVLREERCPVSRADVSRYQNRAVSTDE